MTDPPDSAEPLVSTRKSDLWFDEAVKMYHEAKTAEIWPHTEGYCVLGELAMNIAWFLREKGE